MHVLYLSQNVYNLILGVRWVLFQEQKQQNLRMCRGAAGMYIPGICLHEHFQLVTMVTSPFFHSNLNCLSSTPECGFPRTCLASYNSWYNPGKAPVQLAPFLVILLTASLISTHSIHSENTCVATLSLGVLYTMQTYHGW